MILKIHGAFISLILFSLGTACTEESVADKYLASGGAAASGDSGTEDPGTEDPGTEDPGTEDPGTEDPGTEDPGTMDPGTGAGDAEAGAKLVTDNGCMTCHNGTIAMVVLDKTAVERLGAAKDQTLHAGFKEVFEGTNVANLEAYLKTK